MGWSVEGLNIKKESKLRSKEPKGTVTGLYNWKREYKPINHDLDPADHNMGYVTLLGDYSHPPKINLSQGVPEEPHRARSLTEPRFRPGDFHLRKHEWRFEFGKEQLARSDMNKPDLGPEGVQDDLPASVTDYGRSVPTTEIRKIDSNLRLCVDSFRPFMNRTVTNRWYHPLSSNDVSSYGNAYVKTMHVTPFNKTQLLASR